MKSFEEKTPRARTMSTPRSFSVGLERGSNMKARSGGATSLDPRGSLDTDRSTEPPETPRSVSQDNNSSAIAAMDEWVKISADEAPLVCRIDSSHNCVPFISRSAVIRRPPNSSSVIRIMGGECA